MKLSVYLQQLPAFGRFNAQEIQAFVDCLRLFEYPDGYVFSSQNDPGDSMYVLIDGRVRLFHHDAAVNNTLEVRDVNDGELFNLSHMIDGLAISTTAVASAPCLACQLTREGMTQLEQTAPKVAHQLRYMLGIQLARALSTRNSYLRNHLREQATPARAAS